MGLGPLKVEVRYCLRLGSFEGMAESGGSPSKDPFMWLSCGCRLMLAVDKRPLPLSRALLWGSSVLTAFLGTASQQSKARALMLFRTSSLKYASLPP